MMKARANLSLIYDDNTLIDEKFITLLKSIDETKSLTKSAKKLGISYKNLWDNINKIKNKENFIISKKNGGSFITESSKELIKKYENLNKAQSEFLEKIINIDLEFIPKFYLQLSARNKLKLKITEIKCGIINSEVCASFKSGETLRANITNESLKNMNLKVGDEVYFIFKAPKILISSKQIQNSLLTNIINLKITSAVLGEENAQIIGISKDSEKIIALISNDTLMDLRLKVNDEIGAIIDPNDIIIAI